MPQLWGKEVASISGLGLMGAAQMLSLSIFPQTSDGQYSEKKEEQVFLRLSK